MAKIKVGVIEDNKTLLIMYRHYITSLKDVELAFAAESIEDISSKTKLKEKPDLIFLDIDLDGKSGIDGIPQIKKMFPSAGIIMLTNSEEGKDVIHALKMGAIGYVVKTVDLKDLYNAVIGVLDSGGFLSPQIAREVIGEIQKKNGLNLHVSFSRREQDVLEQLKKGLSYKAIATNLFITSHAVNQHLKRIYKKTGVNSRGELMALWYNEEV
jgi:DNA-binding NarL/FixJ family response regulator